MHIACVTVYVKPDFVDAFIEATRENARNSRQEAENVRFDVLQSHEDPARFMLYEVYQSPEGAAAHKKTAHYLKWRETVADWMAKPREGVLHANVFPADADW